SGRASMRSAAPAQSLALRAARKLLCAPGLAAGAGSRRALDTVVGVDGVHAATSTQAHSAPPRRRGRTSVDARRRGTTSADARRRGVTRAGASFRDGIGRGRETLVCPLG